MQLGSCIAVAAAVYTSSYSSDWIPGLGTSVCPGCGPKKRMQVPFEGEKIEKKKPLFLIKISRDPWGSIFNASISVSTVLLSPEACFQLPVEYLHLDKPFAAQINV